MEIDEREAYRQFYLSSETELLLGKVLTTFMDGDREIMRAFCGALSVEFARLFPFGRLLEVLSYVHEKGVVASLAYRLPLLYLDRLSPVESANDHTIVYRRTCSK